jgi:hypothetical protein
METTMRKLVLAALAVTAFAATMAVNTNDAKAVIYCTSTGVPAGCIVRPVAPVARTAARAAARNDVGRRGTPANRGGPVNRAGRR